MAKRSRRKPAVKPDPEPGQSQSDSGVNIGGNVSVGGDMAAGGSLTKSGSSNDGPLTKAFKAVLALFGLK